MYRAVVTESATRNEPATELGEVDGADPLVEFADEDAARAAVARCTDAGAVPVRLQAPAPQDPRDVDAYVVADPERRIRDPSGSLEAGLTFDTGANQYGALGEALVTNGGANPPVLAAYVRRTEERDLEPSVAVDLDPAAITFVSPATGEREQWHPDCVARATLPDGRERRLFCEIKTGAGSLQRNQRSVMRRAAADREVLLVTVDVADLPEEYTTHVDVVEPLANDEWVEDGGDRSLAEFD